MWLQESISGRKVWHRNASAQRFTEEARRQEAVEEGRRERTQSLDDVHLVWCEEGLIQLNADALLHDVSQRADEATDELLPRILQRIISRKTACIKHSVLLQNYVALKIFLGKVKSEREFHYSFTGQNCELGITTHINLIRERMLIARDVYHTTECQCLIKPKR